MDDISMDETEENQANIQLSPPRKKSKITAESSSSEGNAVNPPQPLIPNHLSHKIYAHTGQCNSVLFLNNSDYLVSGGKDNAIKFWDTTNGALTRSFEGFQGSVCDMAISTNNKFLLAGLTSRKICIWDLNSGQILRTLEGHKQKVCAVCISKVRAENRMFCSGHGNGKIAFISTDRNHHYIAGEIKVHTQSVTSLRSLQNGNVVMSSGRDNLHNLIDVRTMQVCRKFKTKGNMVATNWTRTCISPDENFAAVCSADGMVSIWSIQMGKKIDSMKEHNGSVLSCAWSGMGNSLASADSDGNICIWS